MYKGDTSKHAEGTDPRHSHGESIEKMTKLPRRASLWYMSKANSPKALPLVAAGSLVASGSLTHNYEQVLVFLSNK